MLVLLSKELQSAEEHYNSLTLLGTPLYNGSWNFSVYTYPFENTCNGVHICTMSNSYSHH